MTVKKPSATRGRAPRGAASTDQDVEAVLAAARVLVTVIARSVDTVQDEVTVPQLRILMLVGARLPMNLSAVADALGVHPSNASRACDKLVEAGLLERRDSDVDRRNLVLDLSRRGRAVVDSVVKARRDALHAILQDMTAEDRHGLAPALSAFATAAGEDVGDDHLNAIWSG